MDLYGVGEGWKIVLWPENSIKVEEFFDERPGIIYLRHFIYSPSHRRVMIGVPKNGRMKFWLNGELIHETIKPIPLRPNYGGDGSNYAESNLKKGWNHLMIKIMRGSCPLDAHFAIANSEWCSGMTDLIHLGFREKAIDTKFHLADAESKQVYNLIF